MIKVFKGGYEVAEEYYFNYDSGGTSVYDSNTRIINGLLAVKGLTEMEQLKLVNGLDGSNLVIIEPNQTNYMVNLIYVSDIEMTTTMSNTDSLYRITGTKRMKPKRVNSYKVSALSSTWTEPEVSTLISVTVDGITTDGSLRMAQGTDIRYLWASNTKVSGLNYEIGKCRITDASDFYVTQTGGSNYKMQMPSLSGVPFPNDKLVFSGSSAKITGQILEVN